MPQNGQFLQADYFNNTGGLNLSDTPWRIQDTQATGGFCYDYIQTGGIVKSPGHTPINTIADTQLKTLGLGLHTVSSTNVKTVLRGAGTKFQTFNVDTAAFTNQSEDTTTAGTDFFSSTSTQPIIMNEFSTTTNDIVFAVGGGASQIYGYTGSKITANGVPEPTGVITATPSATGGSFISTGTYFYAVSYHKASTGATGNVALDTSATISNVTDKVTIDLTGLTNLDSTKYDKVYIYRSVNGGFSGFTSGDLIAQLNSTSTSYVDTGSFITTAENIARSGNIVLDDGALPSGTYKTLAVWKRRLVTANNNTLYLSDLNKSESWPLTNTITLPNGGPITGLCVIGFNTPTTTGVDEFLAIFQERQLWILLGSDYTDWALKFVDAVGAATQSVIVNCNGFMTWLDYRGIYMWDGSSKPIYVSRPLEPLFQPDGDLLVSNLNQSTAQFFRKFNTVYWVVPHKTYGNNKTIIKLDLRLTLPQVGQNLLTRMLDAVFIMDKQGFAIYGLLSFLPNNTRDEIMLAGDDAGFVYRMYDSEVASTATPFTYQTPFLGQGNSNIAKRYHKVIVWVDKIGDWNLYLDYWTNFKTANSSKSTVATQIDPAQDGKNAIWDIALWDVAQWDDYNTDKKALVFNLASTDNNAEGDCIKLQFRQEDSSAPVTINGYSVIYSEIGMRK